MLPLTGELSLGPDWLLGRFEWNPELHFAMFTHPYNRPIIGITPLQLRYVFAERGRFSPYGIAGAGVLHSNINRAETGSAFNFNLQFGVGTLYRVSDKASLIAEYRHLHISNGGIDEDNLGLDAHTFLAGVSIKR